MKLWTKTEKKIVRRAYVQVAKNKDCPMTERQEAVRKLKRLFMDRWNKNYPFSKVQRLEQTLAVIAAVCKISDQGLEEESWGSSRKTIRMTIQYEV